MATSELSNRQFFLIIYSVPLNGHKRYILDFPMKHLEVFKRMDPKDYSLYIPHDHDHGEPWRFRNLSKAFYLGSYSDIPSTIPAIVDRTVYGFYADRGFMSLNLDIPDAQWETALPPIAPERWSPKLISLDNKLYVFGGFATFSISNVDTEVKPFGEVFDPQTRKWSPLKPPPECLVICADRSLFIASLREFEGKIMVHNPFTDTIMIYIYDIRTDIWDKYCAPELGFNILSDDSIFGSAFATEGDNNLYWIEKKSALMFAFNWPRNQLYSGAIIGLEDLDTLFDRAVICEGVFLHHLSADLFCIIWWSVNGNPYPQTTDIHVTVLRVCMDSTTSSLDALVVGCFHDTIEGDCRIFSALPI
ncbi:hypothetical protein RND81_03G113900 [Saponaria officinalis]|uniref:Uncharacterized protein n=1 Tax=Saponaria officinalis TaxID=3572 RepID=A0AAW1M9V2_SAPOF